MYANAGGGHRRPAEALAEELTRQYGKGVEPELVDATGASAITKYILEQGYAFSADYFQWIYKALFEVSATPAVIRLENYAATKLIKDFFVKKLQAEKPEKIVAFFYLLGPVREALRELGWRVPIVAVVTDPFTSHPFWFFYPELSYVVFSDAIKQEALRAGVPETNITVVPPIVHSKFKHLPETSEQENFRRHLGFLSNQKIVLLIGGGNGLPQGSEALEKLLESDLAAHLAIVCGNNKRLKNKAEALREKYGRDRLTVYGFVDFIEQLMAVADVVIGKAGASVMMETLTLQKPLIIINYIWGQEQGNVEYVVKNKLGFFEPDLTRLPQLVQRVLFDTATIQGLEEQRKIMPTKSGTEEIARYIYEFGTDSH